MTPILGAPKAVEYPSSDGQPMADNTLQFEWIVTIKCGLEILFRSAQDVFIAGDLLWYPVEGQPRICVAPDTMVVFGRPKGHRDSYRQWDEGGIGPQVVFEVLSRGNRPKEMLDKLDFYDTYGVEEYYLYDPYEVSMQAWVRHKNALKRIHDLKTWVSPRLRIRFEFGTAMVIIGPDGRPFATFLELDDQRRKAEAQAEKARIDAAQERSRVERLSAQLRALGQEPEA